MENIEEIGYPRFLFKDKCKDIIVNNESEYLKKIDEGYFDNQSNFSLYIKESNNYDSDKNKKKKNK